MLRHLGAIEQRRQVPRLLRQNSIHQGDGTGVVAQAEHGRRAGELQRRGSFSGLGFTDGGGVVQAADAQRLGRQKHQVCRGQTVERRFERFG